MRLTPRCFYALTLALSQREREIRAGSSDSSEER
jgi:hypothetical protein